MKTNCEFCMNYYYDDEYECYCCAINLDEDEMYRKQARYYFGKE